MVRQPVITRLTIVLRRAACGAAQTSVVPPSATNVKDLCTRYWPRLLNASPVSVLRSVRTDTGFDSVIARWAIY